MNQLLWNTFLIASPLLVVTLVVGVVISVLQVATQVQEMSLSYVPKLVAALLVFVVFGPWMLNRVTQFAITLIRSIPDLG